MRFAKAFLEHLPNDGKRKAFVMAMQVLIPPDFKSKNVTIGVASLISYEHTVKMLMAPILLVEESDVAHAYMQKFFFLGYGYKAPDLRSEKHFLKVEFFVHEVSPCSRVAERVLVLQQV